MVSSPVCSEEGITRADANSVRFERANGAGKRKKYNANNNNNKKGVGEGGRGTEQLRQPRPQKRTLGVKKKTYPKQREVSYPFLTTYWEMTLQVDSATQSKLVLILHFHLQHSVRNGYRQTLKTAAFATSTLKLLDNYNRTASSNFLPLDTD